MAPGCSVRVLRDLATTHTAHQERQLQSGPSGQKGEKDMSSLRALSTYELDAVNGGHSVLNIQGNGNSGSDTGNSNGSGNHSDNGNTSIRDAVVIGGDVKSGNASWFSNSGNLIVNNG
jgi:hypothetical protein